MTTRETERLAKLEQKIDDLPKTIVVALDGRYLTRREGTAASVVLTLLVLVFGIWDGVKSHFK